MITSQTMKVSTILASLYLSLAVLVPQKKLQNGFPARGSMPIFVVVEGLDVAKISSLPRSRIGTTMFSTRPEAVVQPTRPPLPGYYLNSIRKVSPTSSSLLKTMATTEWQERKQCLSRLCSKNSDDNETNDSIRSDADSGSASDDITDENSPMDHAVTTDEASASASASATMKDRRKDSLLSDFLYGANYVHSQYLSILWRYSILRSFAVTLPIGIVLWWVNQANGLVLYDSLFRVLRSFLTISSVAARLLQLPLEFAQSLVLSIWNVSPEAMVAAIDFLPNAAAIPVVQLLLSVRAAVTSVVEACCSNNVITFLSSMAAILVWRPAIEEWQYRSVLDKVLFGAPSWILARGQELSPSTIAMIQRITSIGSNLTGRRSTIGITNNETLSLSEPSTFSSVQTVGNLSLSNQSVEVKDNNGNSTSTADGQTNGEEESAYTPFLPDESTRILLGSLLFATTRLGWLSSDPFDTVALSNSPYGFTIGFLQSIGSLVSSGGGVPEVRQSLRIFILLLAIHQTVSSFLVAQHVFAGIYRQRGLAASVGAHVSWTVGKGTIPFRLVWKFWQSTFASVWSDTRDGGSSSPDTTEATRGGDDDDDDDE